jgi:hypothetical protein
MPSNWKFVLTVAATGEQIADLALAFGKSGDFDLYDFSTSSFSINSRVPEARLIKPIIHDIRGYEDGYLRFQHKILSYNRSGIDNSTLNFSCADYRSWLNRLKLQSDDEAVQYGYNNATMAFIAKELLDTVQERTNGDLGITVDMSVTGRSITKKFQAGQSVWEAINDFTNLDDDTEEGTTEWDVFPNIETGGHVLQLFVPQRGSQLLNYKFSNKNSFLSFSEEMSAAEYANHITVQGNAGELEVQSLAMGGPTGGTFKIRFKGADSEVILYNATVETVQEAIEKITTVGSDNVEVYSTAVNKTIPGGTVWIKFIGDLAYQPQPLLEIVEDAVTGGTGIHAFTRRAVGKRYSAVWQTADFETSPYGRVEAYIFDETLTDQASCDERAIFLGKIYGTLSPIYAFELLQGVDRPNLGDRVAVVASDEWYITERDDLRASHISLGMEDGSVSVTVEAPKPVDRTIENLKRRVAAAEAARLRAEADIAARQKIETRKKFEALTKLRSEIQARITANDTVAERKRTKVHEQTLKLWRNELAKVDAQIKALGLG